MHPLAIIKHLDKLKHLAPGLVARQRKKSEEEIKGSGVFIGPGDRERCQSPCPAEACSRAVEEMKGEGTKTASGVMGTTPLIARYAL